MLFRLIHFAAMAAETTTAAEAETTLIETEFAGATVPTSMTVLFGAGLVLMAAAAVVVVMYLRNHVKNWAFPMYAGAIFYLLLRYIAIQGISILLGFVPAVKAYAEAHNRMAPPAVQMGLYGARILTDSAAIYFGIRYFRNTAAKRNIEPVIGHAFSFGVACYICYVIVSGAFTSYFQYISIAGTINSNGFDAVLTSLVNGDTIGATQEYYTEYLNSYVNPDVWRVFFSTFINKEFWGGVPGIWPTMVMCAVYIAAAVLAYGFQIKKLNVKWLLAAFGLIVLLWVPFVLSVALDLPAWPTGLWYTGLLALSLLSLFYVCGHELKDELKAFSYSRVEEQQKEYQKAHKMPKIVMPRDEDLPPVGSKGQETAENKEEDLEAKKAAEEAFGMTEAEAEAMMADAEEAAEEVEELPEDGGKEEL